jgi:hypothetical protein
LASHARPRVARWVGGAEAWLLEIGAHDFLNLEPSASGLEAAGIVLLSGDVRATRTGT